MKAGVCESLHEVAATIATGEASSLVIGNFLAFLRPDGVQVAIEEPPALLAKSHPAGATLDAYLAAVAESLALKRGLKVPVWTESPARFLDHYHFPSRNKRLNEHLLRETPEPFRRRGIVVSDNALDVA